MSLRLFLPFLLLFFLLGGCASTEEDETAGMSPAEIYAEAHEKLENKEYEAAAQWFEKLEARYPYGPYAEQAQLEVAYAYYKANEPESAILSAERFIKLHPNHPKVDYAYYLRGLAAYDSDQSFINKIFKQNPNERDPKSARRAFRFFSELVKRFPDSMYADDAIARMYRIREGLAEYELFVIDYYTRRSAFVAVANRAKYVLENYQGTAAVPRALAAMVNAYVEMGLNDLAQDALKVLEMNYPEYKDLKKLRKKVAAAEKEASKQPES